MYSTKGQDTAGRRSNAAETTRQQHTSSAFVSVLTVSQGKRYSMPNSRIMIHQPLGGAQGQATDIEIQANEILHHKLTLNGYLVRDVTHRHAFINLPIPFYKAFVR